MPSTNTVLEPLSVGRDIAPKQMKTTVQDFQSYSATESTLHDTPTDGQGLLEMFMDTSNATTAQTESEPKRAHEYMNEESDFIRQPSPEQINAVKTESESISQLRRRRMFRAGSRHETEKSGAMTESEQYNLISRYTDSFLKHMQAVEQPLNRQAKKPSVVSKVRHHNVGKTHLSIASLHREFTSNVAKCNTTSTIRCSLQAELEKFERALPYWWPKCKALPTQKDRLAMVQNLVENIARDGVDIENYKDCYDPYDEL